MHQYQTYDNESLLDLLSTGDTDAYTELYNRYWKKVYVVAFNRIKEAAAAEDIAQEVFSSLWANRTKVKILALENYLATAAKFTVLTAIRKKELARLYNKTECQTADVVLPVDISLHYKQILEVLSLEVEKLPEKCKIIFKYSRNEGMPVKEIAKELKISPKTVENQINRALKHLRLVSRTFMHSLVTFFL